MISIEEVKHILQLSSLEVSDEELKKLQTSLSQMEEFISQIQNADVDDEIAISNAVSMNELREDKVENSYPVEEILKNAPKQKFNSFAVPLMMED